MINIHTSLFQHVIIKIKDFYLEWKFVFHILSFMRSISKKRIKTSY